MSVNRLIWQATGFGVVAGVPLSLLGEILLSTGRNDSTWLYVAGLLLAAPGAAYSAVTGKSPFTGTASLLTYFLLQIAYCTAVSFVVLLLFRSGSRSS